MGVDAVMLVTTSRELGIRELQQISASLAAAVGPEHFMLDRENGWRALMGESIEDDESWSDEDCQRILPPPGGQLLKVQIMGRYYGVGYERGSWPTLDAIAGWLFARLPGARVWYGGDSSDDLRELTPESRAALWAHWYAVGREPYTTGFGQSKRVCDFCGGRRLIHAGGGGSGGEMVEFLLCDGCELHAVEVGPHHEYHELPRGVEFFGWREALAKKRAKSTAV
jgi:hypothetical protein